MLMMLAAAGWLGHRFRRMLMMLGVGDLLKHSFHLMLMMLAARGRVETQLSADARGAGRPCQEAKNSFTP